MVKRLEERWVVGRLHLKQCIFCLFHNLEHPFISELTVSFSLMTLSLKTMQNLSEVEVMLVLKVSRTSGTYKWGQKEFNTSS